MKLNKEACKALAKRFKEEQARKHPGSDLKYLGIRKLLTFVWWGIFKERRAVYFMHLLDKGMAHLVAFNYAKKTPKEEIDGVLYLNDYLK